MPHPTTFLGKLAENFVPLQVLVGESIVKQSDPGKGIAGLFGKDISLSPN